MPIEIFDYSHKNVITNSFHLKGIDILCKFNSVIFDYQQFSAGDVNARLFAREMSMRLK